MLRGVSLQERDDREIASPLDGGGQLALMARAGSAEPARKDFPLIGYEPSEGSIVLVIDPAYAPFAERAAFLRSSHFRLILVIVVIVAARCLCSELFFAHRRGTDFVLVQRDQIADDATVELEGALVFGKHGRVGGKA